MVYDTDPEKLVQKIIALLDEKYADIEKNWKDLETEWFLDGPKPNRAG